MANTTLINDRCNRFFDQFDGDIQQIVSVMSVDMEEYGIVDGLASKLLRLASCPSSPIGERTNAARAAFKRIFS